MLEKLLKDLEGSEDDEEVDEEGSTFFYVDPEAENFDEVDEWLMEASEERYWIGRKIG